MNNRDVTVRGDFCHLGRTEIQSKYIPTLACRILTIERKFGHRTALRLFERIFDFLCHLHAIVL